MIIVMKTTAASKDIAGVLQTAENLGLKVQVSKESDHTIVGVLGDECEDLKETFLALSGVEEVVPILKPFKLVSKDFKSEQTVVNVGNVRVGDGFVVIAGPCAVESREMIIEVAQFVKDEGANILRGGAFKPRTSPYSFQGLGDTALEFLALAREKTGLPVVTEVLTPEDVPIVCKYVDILQVGARNIQNFKLLQAAGKSSKPVLLKRGMMSKVEEFLLSAEYILAEGNPNVILCERGIRTFETYTRNTLDISCVPLIKGLSHLPIIVDPSHATGKRDLVIPLARAAFAVAADGVMVEVHPDPKNAKSDGPQSLSFHDFQKMMNDIKKMRTIGIKQ